MALQAAAVALFTPREWARANGLFRRGGQVYQDAPRGRDRARKATLLFRHFPHGAGLEVQCAYLVKNLVNLQRWPDANKRTAALLLEVFLARNGHRLVASNEAFERLLVESQRLVPPAWWEGRTFSLRAERVPWNEDDDYHRWLASWFEGRLVPLP